MVVVRGSESYPPYEMQIEGQLAGFHIDLIKAVAKALGVTVGFESYPWKRAMYMVREGLVDAISFISKNDDRSEFVTFTPGNELSFANVALIVLESKKSRYHFNGHSLNTLSDYIFGHNLGFIYGDFYDKLTLNKKPFNTYEQLFSNLRLERIDIALVNYDVFNTFKMVAQPITYKLTALDKKVAVANYIAFSKRGNQQQFSVKFSKAMMAYKKSKDFLKLIKKYKLKELTVLNSLL
jgi:polar amino acid transport system substrate-binding protein